MVIIGIPSLYVAGEIILTAWNRSPAEMQTFEGLAAWRSPRDVGVVRREEGEFLIVLGPNVGLLTSGPSAFVFDPSGGLVDQTRDIGDDNAFNHRWPRPWEMGFGIADARRWLEDEVPNAALTPGGASP